jgi:Ca2+-transporting ATPase
MAFLTMSMAEIFHSFNMRSQRGSIFTLGTINWALWISLGAALLLTSVVCQVPALAAAFSFTTVTLREFGVAIGLGALVIPLVEIVKIFQRHAGKAGQK